MNGKAQESPSKTAADARGEVDPTAELSAHLLSQLTPRRRGRFEQVLAGRTRRLAVVLENLSHSHNFSAILRSCDCFGVQDVHVIDPRDTFDVSKDVALGAEKWLTVTRYLDDVSTTDALCQIKAAGYRVAVTSPHGNAVSLYDAPVDMPVALVFGTELEGASESVEAEADLRIRIPMFGFTESFNVSVAAALCLAELSRRIRDQVPDWALTEEEKDSLRLTWARQSIKNVDLVEERFWQTRSPR